MKGVALAAAQERDDADGINGLLLLVAGMLLGAALVGAALVVSRRRVSPRE